MRVVARDGQVWSVRRRLVAPRVTFRSIVAQVHRTGAGDLTADFYTMDQGVRREAAGTLSLALMLLAILERVVLIVVAPVTLSIRLLHLKPGTLEAHQVRSTREPRTWMITGWSASHDFLRTISIDLEHGHRLPKVNQTNG